MKEADIILATGGPGMVKAAYSSGKPALGVGAGNSPAIIDDTADIKLAVNSIIHSKTFDNGMICASEQSVTVLAPVYEAVKKEFVYRGCYFLKPDEIEKVRKTILINGSLNAKIVGQSAYKIAKMAGVEVPEDTKILINPSGRFVCGGLDADTGLTGRKLMVDTYGGLVPHGGGAFSGKDCSKVDRSGAYMARYIAKNMVAAGLASRCQVSLAYAIGVAQPVMVQVDTFGTGKICADDCLAAAIPLVFGLTPSQICDTLHLKRPIYRQSAVFGHFGRKEFPWEKTDKAEQLRDTVM